MTTMIQLSDFDANLVQFAAPKKLDQGGVIGITYNGENALTIKLPVGRVPFDCSKGYQDKGTKIEMKIELPAASPEFEVARRVLSEIDTAVRNHLRDAASDICAAIVLKGAKEKDLRAGINFHGLLRPSTKPRYPDSVTLKWAAPDPTKPSTKDVAIVDIQNNPVNWETIKRGAQVVAVIRVKGVFVNTNLAAVQVEPMAVCVISAKKEVATIDLFAEEMELHSAKRQRVEAPASEAEEEEGEES